MESKAFVIKTAENKESSLEPSKEKYWGGNLP